MNEMSQPRSLGSMTGTRVDSATKHVRTCRVAEDYITSFLKQSRQAIESDEGRAFAIQKDQLFMGCGPSLIRENTMIFCNKKAYALGLSSLHGLEETVCLLRGICVVLCMKEHQYIAMVQNINTDIKKLTTKQEDQQYANFPEFFCLGVALTDASPSACLGDTALSVMTGGMATLQNGPFLMNAGDTVTWIWEYETKFFEVDGSFVVIKEDLIEKLDDHYNTYHTGGGDFDTFLQDVEKEVAKDTDKLPKKRPYDVIGNTAVNKTQERRPRIIQLPLDAPWVLRKRAFGRCMGFAQAFNAVDIQIGRQGL